MGFPCEIRTGLGDRVFPSYILFSSKSLNKNFHDLRTIPSGRKVCVGSGGGGRFEGKFSVSFGPTNKDLGFGFRDWDQAEQQY
jgi:hypothetical protein